MQEHEDILEALKARDGSKLSTLLRELSENSLRREKHRSMAAAKEVTSLQEIFGRARDQRLAAAPNSRSERALRSSGLAR